MRARSMFCLVVLISAACPYAMYAQQGGPGAQPALMECGARGAAEIICGTRSPEDMEPAPDGRRLIVSHMAGRDGPRGGLALFDPEAKSLRK